MTNKPATPLPWSSQHNKRTTFREPHGAIFSMAQTLDGSVGKTFKDADAAYIAHAANAYPKLVESIRKVEARRRSGDVDRMYDAMLEQRELLRELGEMRE